MKAVIESSWMISPEARNRLCLLVRNTVDLYVGSDIKVDTHTDPYTASEGRVSHYPDWEPAEEDLRPRKYEYRLPDTTG
ncbi:hypothetical protein ACFWAN_22100 [Streptomyces mirabilis]|uniref:hypothetical protein n=1 Tax=Streptomyces mirabilis TaxID=68239 RepID=UPI0036535006